jgi:hypothetical protein
MHFTCKIVNQLNDENHAIVCIVKTMETKLGRKPQSLIFAPRLRSQPGVE